MLLLCNNRTASIEVLDNLPITEVPESVNLIKQQSITLSELKRSQQWKAAREAAVRLVGE
jgi:beta-N-acetylhexosaminidase